MLGPGAVPANDSRCTDRDTSGPVRVRYRYQPKYGLIAVPSKVL